MIYNLEQVYFEVTRRCNLRCDHYCMRGPAQNIELSKEDVDLFFDQINIGVIDLLTFGGGEPTLNPGIISYTIDKIIKKGIIVLELGMITNGQIYSQEIVNAFKRYEKYIKSNDEYNYVMDKYLPGFKLHPATGIYFSKDDYHQKVKPDVEKEYRDNGKNINIGYQCTTKENIVKTGLATTGYEYRYRLLKTKYEVLDEDTVNVYGDIDLNARGLVLNNPVYDYIDADMKNFGHIKDFSMYDFLVNNGIPEVGTINISEVVRKRKRKIKARAN